MGIKVSQPNTGNGKLLSLYLGLRKKINFGHILPQKKKIVLHIPKQMIGPNYQRSNFFCKKQPKSIKKSYNVTQII